ncbi:MAG TPA: class I SAM-dependent methyltransferase [Actinomycetaceae bacterium]|nr:class I SAM-dependent methyltransferase [Georgenia satyanarayanai]HLS72460.1 class I SAM-dependent methyltransferase [Actinomycetaceae bacterium]
MPTMSFFEALLCRSAPWRCLARRILPWSTQGFSLAGEVLEVGGGSGAMAAELGRTDRQVRLTVTDLDPVMARAARQRLAHLPHVVVHQADATRLPYKDGSFDAVTSFLMLHHVIEWESAVSEASRVLRPGGMFLGYDLVASRVASLVHLVDRSPHRLIERGTLEPVLARAGLQAVTVQYSLRGLVLRFAARKPRPPQPGGGAIESTSPATGQVRP